MRKIKKQSEDAANNGKNYENKSLMGPLKSLGDPGKYPVFPPPPLGGPAYTTVTPHSNSRRDVSAFVMSHVQYTTYKIIPRIERAIVLGDNIMRVTSSIKTVEGVLSYSQLTKPLRILKLFKKPQNSEL